ncbi:IS200/IS605 family transposase [Myxococcota bacterium]|nr:IS200/IS605 family transposase [Myxococcota bacterium]MBU1496555.1 IS200/IS605 family transposase [Myxococcota bacterium]
MSNTYNCSFHHIIFSTKDRKYLIKEYFREDMYRIIINVSNSHRCKIIKINGIEDHIHILVQIHPSISNSRYLQIIKGTTTSWVNEKVRPSYGHFSWQEGYSIFSVSYSNLESVKSYIEKQELHHLNRTFLSEITLLNELTNN